MNTNQTTGYPSIDKPWLKYYDSQIINQKLPLCSVYDFIYQNNKNHIDNIALNYFDVKYTYNDLFCNIEKAERAFYYLGVKENDIVTICSVTIPETIYSFYALNHIGAISNMVDPRVSAEGLKDYINEVNSKVVVCISDAYNKISSIVDKTCVEKVIVISPSDSLKGIKKFVFDRLKAKKINENNKTLMWNTFINLGGDCKPVYPNYKKDKCCVIVHTGGTTGTPKGVMLTNDNINSCAVQAFRAGFDFKRTHNWLCIMPPFIAYGVGNGLHLPLYIGMEVILIPAFDPNKFDDLLNKYKPNHMVGVPSHYEKLLYSKKLKNKDLSYIIAPTVGGDALSIDLEQKINEYLLSHNCNYKIVKGYGMSEACAAVCACASNETNAIGSVGIPFPNMVISVFEPGTDKEHKFGELGEICISGPNIMSGYYNNSKETNNVIKLHNDGIYWLHSGDIGTIDYRGFVYIKDRIKRIIIKNDGFKVFPSQIEDVLCSAENIENACVVAKHVNGFSEPIAYVSLKSCDCDFLKEKSILMNLCKEKLPEYAQPIDFIIKERLPLTPIGKIDYKSLENEANI